VKTALYRQFNKENKLLYVGISLDYSKRIKQHYKGSAWFLDVTNIELQWFDTREEALKAEREAIRVEQPECNKHHINDGDERVPKFRHDAREFQGMNAQVMRHLENNGKMFLTKGEVASLVGINNFHLKGWLESKKLKSMQPFYPVSNREVFYIDDVIDCIKKVVEEQRQ
jgi:predicted GIY-YIG superfamily endonuclease